MEISEISNKTNYQESVKVNPLNDSVLIIGYVFLGISLVLHTFPEILSTNTFRNGLGGAAFWIIYLMSINYLILLLTTKKMRFFWKKQPVETQPYRFLLWTIGLVGCFALNRDIPVFQTSTTWLSVCLVLTGGSLILLAWKEFLPKIFQKVLFSFLGASAVLFLYFSIYLIWIYPISIIGMLFLGISFFSFIPLILLVGLIIVFVRNWEEFNKPILAGIFLPVLLIFFFLMKWISIDNKLRFARNDTFTSPTDDLPNWVLLAQKMDKDWITERYLKTDIVYQTPSEHFDFIPERNFDEIREHDPLVMIAFFFVNKTQIPENERIKLLELFYDSRHNSQERLWSGRDLHTENVITQAKIYPEFRLAYTEKTISIRNAQHSSWSQQEALYTFFVPEGSVVSSLSLWINGREEKAALTTQAKADSAYKTIVGVESRDPSVVHWQEGNRLTVRVFPCTSKENRTFKIGITSPLKLENNNLIYENIYFKGPESKGAKETIKVDFSQKIDEIDVPWTMGDKTSSSVATKGNYRSDWKLSIPAVSLSKESFSFQGENYYLSNLQVSSEPFEAENIYLDLNESWSRNEFETLCNSFTTSKLWVYDDAFKTITKENQNEVFDKLSSNRFSLFPFHRIPNVSSALVITKATELSPILMDLKGSLFAESFKKSALNGKLVKTFVIGDILSPYLKTLKELRIIQTHEGNMNDLQAILTKKQFPQNVENEQVIKIAHAKMLIQKDSTQIKSANVSTPDHLLRLFAYNHILQEIGQQYFTKNYVNDKLINEASTANIVSPISSLIVLETQADYDRFDIQKNRDGLGNATLKNSGAVPEPHEWLLIVLFASFVLYYYLKGNGRV